MTRCRVSAKKLGLDSKNREIQRRIEIRQIFFADAVDFDHLFAEKLHNERRHPLVATLHDVGKILLWDKPIIMPCQRSRSIPFVGW